MKHLIILSILSLFANSLFAQNDTIKSETKITDVIVFLGGAQINRQADVNLTKGSNIIVFTDLSTFIDEKSVQVKTGENTTILSVKHNTNYLDKPKKKEEIVNLEKRKKEIKFKMEENNLLIWSYNQDEDLIIQNKLLGGRDKPVTSSELDSASVLFRKRLTEIRLKQIELKKISTEYNEETTKINQQLTELNNTKAEQTGEIIVVIAAERSGMEKFTLNYAVSNAGWIPKYDIRADDISKPLDLMYKADVYQNTGYDWENVNLILSTGNPSESGEKPLLATWFLDFYNPYYYRQQQQQQQNVQKTDPNIPRGTITGIVRDETGSSIPGAIVKVKDHPTIATVTDFSGKYILENVPSNAYILVFDFIDLETTERHISGYNTINATLLPSDTELDEVVVTAMGVSKDEKKIGYAVTTVGNEELTYTQDRSALDALSGKVAGVKTKGGKGNKKDKNLMAPPENILDRKQTSVEYILEKPYTINSDNKKHTVEVKEYEVEADYVYYCVPKMENTAFLTAKIPDWELYNLLTGKANLFFEGAYVGTSLIDVDNAKDTIVFSLSRDNDIVLKREKLKDFTKRQYIGTNIIETFAFEISIRNKKAQAIDIIVEDQFPMSSNDDIVVKQLEMSGAELDEETGKLTWELHLDAKEIKKLTNKFSVKYPKKTKINL